VALFSDEKELVDRVKYYLTDDKARENIATQGHQRCLELGLSWQEHIQREWQIIRRILVNGSTDYGIEENNPFWNGFRQGIAWNSNQQAQIEERGR
jgi:spore maturation protein CgeB